MPDGRSIEVSVWTLAGPRHGQEWYVELETGEDTPTTLPAFTSKGGADAAANTLALCYRLDGYRVTYGGGADDGPREE